MKTKNRIGLEILSRITTNKFALLIKYSFQGFRTIENGLSFFSYYNDKLIFVEISEDKDMLLIRTSLENVQISSYSCLELLPILLTSNMESLIKEKRI